MLTPQSAFADEAAASKPDPETVLRAAMLSRCERGWTRNFIPMVKAQLPATDPANDESRQVVLELVADLKGKILAVDVATSSGARALDQAAKDIAMDTGPLPRLDASVLSDDGNVHASWVFARKDGDCTGLTIKQLLMPAEQAIPALLSQGREARAVERFAEALVKANDKAVAAFAQHWFARAAANADTRVALTGTSALAENGSAAALSQIVALAETGQLPGPLWVQLAKSGHPICSMAKKALADSNPQGRLAALQALGGRFDKECLGDVVAVALNKAASGEERVAALEALARSDSEEARAASRKAMDDTQVKVRAAAIRSWAQPDRGLRALYGLTALMKETDPSVRAAIHAGIARSSGDKGLEQLYLVYKEKDSQIFEALSEELGQKSSEASAGMLRRFLTKDDPRIRRAAAAALGRRSDRFARSASATLANESDPSLRILASHAMKPADVDAAAKVVDPKHARWAYGLLLEAGLKAPASKLMLNAWSALNDEARVQWLSMWLRAVEPPAKVASSRP